MGKLNLTKTIFINKYVLSVALFLLGVTLALGQTNEENIPPASTYAPNIWLHKEEGYYPTNPLNFYYNNALQEISGEEAKQKYNALSIEEKLKNFAAFYSIDKTSTPDIVYQYWYFYVFNNGLNEHYGDWESVFVVIDRKTQKIKSVLGSFHQGGNTNTGIFDSKKLSDVKHPWVYIAKGSHSNCPDYAPDGKCNLSRWNLAEGNFFNNINTYTPKIAHDSPYYKLTPLEDLQREFEERHGENKSLISKEKSPTLGMVPLKIGKKQFYGLPLGGDPPQNAWAKAEYKDPNKAKPITKELVVLKTQQGVASVWNKVKQGAQYVWQQTKKVTKEAEKTLQNPDNLSAELSIREVGLPQKAVAEQKRNENTPPTTVPPDPTPTPQKIILQQKQIQKEEEEKKTVQAEALSSPTPQPTQTPQPQKQIKEKIQEPSITWCSPSPDAIPQYSSVIFKEIAWMGTTNSSFDEWMQLKNTQLTPINLSGWQLLNKNQEISILFGPEYGIPASGTFLLERTDDTTLPDIPANYIYKGGLKNEDEALYLFDNTCALQDKVIADPKWPGGDNDTKQPMRRLPELTWEQPKQPMYALGSNTNPQQQQPKEENQVQIYQKILISEIQIESNISAKDEFIELFNPTNENIDLSGWSLKKKTSSGNESNLVSAPSFRGAIGANGYFLITPQDNEDGTKNYRGEPTPDFFYSGKTYAIAENNTILLYNPNSELVDKVGLGNATDFEETPAENPPAGYSVGRKIEGASPKDTDNNAQDFEIQNPTPRARNAAQIMHATQPENQEQTQYTLNESEAQQENNTATEGNEEIIEDPETIEDDVQEEETETTEQLPEETTIPPKVLFGSLAPVQQEAIFTLSWELSNPIAIVTPSNIDGVVLWYHDDPNENGESTLQYRIDEENEWQQWQAKESGMLPMGPENFAVQLQGQDKHMYTFYAKTKDKGGNESEENSISTRIELPTHSVGKVIINEVAWMGTKADANDEWIELYNASEETINITDWKFIIGDDDSKSEIMLSGTLLPKRYHLLIRSDAHNLREVYTPSTVYKGAMRNDGEILKLYDAKENLIDAVDASSGWFAGINEKNSRGDWVRASMERISPTEPSSDSSNWTTNNLILTNGKDAKYFLINGTPGERNSATPLKGTETRISYLRFDEFDHITLTKSANPYYATASLKIPKKKILTIEPGVTLQMVYGKNVSEILVEGTLNAQGTEENQIIFTNYGDGNFPNWCGMHFTPTSTNSKLEFVVIEKAATAKPSCSSPSSRSYSIWAEQSNVVIRNAILKGSGQETQLYLADSESEIDHVEFQGISRKTMGIEIQNGSPTVTNSSFSEQWIGILVQQNPPIKPSAPVVRDNTFTDNAYPIRLFHGSTQLANNTATDNEYNAIFIQGPLQDMNFILPKDAMPYMIYENFLAYKNRMLTIEPGVVIKFAGLTPESQLIIRGSLLSKGTAENPVIFTALGDDSVAGVTSPSHPMNSWRRIHFTPESSGSVLEHTIIKYGGSKTDEGAIVVEQSDVQFKNVTIQNSVHVGIQSISGKIFGTIQELSGNEYDFYITGACPKFTNLKDVTFHPDSVICSFSLTPPVYREVSPF
ncbi:MAG: lamin tail domain-containing protein [Candidatus Wildermuthbacteria bacterium]|nr:lamin tail domain-containing protein [Candidatus Wildermuthbacteria bacterium]